MILRIRAIDTLFFKDAKPFSMGEESWAESMFPPPPSVIFGAIRTLYFSQNPSEIGLANTQHDPTRHLEIKSISFRSQETSYYIAPRDVVHVKPAETGDDVFGVLNLEQQTEITSSIFPAKLAWKNDAEIIEHQEGFVTERSLSSYVKDNTWRETSKVTPYRQRIGIEPKVGIGRNRQLNSVDEGLLYRVGMMRMAIDDIESVEDLYIDVDVDGLTDKDIASVGFMKLGGEGKAAKYELVKAHKVPAFHWENNSSYFKMYLLTPAIFKNGHLPSWLIWSEEKRAYFGEWQGLRIKLLTAAIGKPLPIGGYDIQKNRPKPLLKAVPAGSVYYFEMDDAGQSHLLPSLQYQSVSESFEMDTAIDSFRPTSAQEGFGRVLLCSASQPPK